MPPRLVFIRQLLRQEPLIAMSSTPGGSSGAELHQQLAPLNAPDLASFFSIDHAVYTDYLTLEPQP
jgi:hypothetical protein